MTLYILFAMRRHRQTGYSSNIAVLIVKPSAYPHADTILSDVLATGLFEVLVRRDIALPSLFWSAFYNDYARSNQAEIEAAMASGPCRAVLLCGSRASHHRHLVAARSLRGLVVGRERRPGDDVHPDSLRARYRDPKHPRLLNGVHSSESLRAACREACLMFPAYCQRLPGASFAALPQRVCDACCGLFNDGTPQPPAQCYHIGALGEEEDEVVIVMHTCLLRVGGGVGPVLPRMEYVRGDWLPKFESLHDDCEEEVVVEEKEEGASCTAAAQCSVLVFSGHSDEHETSALVADLTFARSEAKQAKTAAWEEHSAAIAMHLDPAAINELVDAADATSRNLVALTRRRENAKILGRQRGAECYGALMDVFSADSMTSSSLSSSATSHSSSSSWTALPDMIPCGASYVGGPAVQGTLVALVGGYNDGATSSCRLYAARSKMWYTLPELPEKRIGGSLGILGGYMYLVGGKRFSTVQDDDIIDGVHSTSALSTECIRLHLLRALASPSSDAVQWESCAFPDDVDDQSGDSSSVVEARFEAASLVYAGRLYICGGVCVKGSLKGQFTATCDVIELSSPGRQHCRTRIASMHVPRARASIVVVGSGMYVLGGLTRKTSENERTMARCIERYDLATDRWDVLRLRLPRGGMYGGGAVAVGGSNILILGGKYREAGDKGRRVATVTLFNIETGSSDDEAVADLPAPTSGFRVASLPGNVL